MKQMKLILVIEEDKLCGVEVVLTWEWVEDSV